VTGTARIAALGLAVTPPSGWEATIFRRSAAPGELTFPVLHAATLPLAPARGDYGGGQVELLSAGDLFVGLLEFGPEAARTPLFSRSTGVPGLTPDAFRPNQLQRVIRSQAGVQRFFSVKGRAFCLYVVVGSFANRGALTNRANQLIGSLEIGSSS
jgi:hypothetical protein